MARNGSGTYTLPYPTFTTGTPISSTQVNANNADLTTAMTGSMPRDGQAAPTANIPFGTYKITGLGAGSAATDSITLGQTQAQAYMWGGTAAGTKNALTLSPNPAITAYAAGQTFRFKSGSTQSDDAVTVAVSGLTTKAIQSEGAALSATTYIEASKWYQITYDGAAFQIEEISLNSISAIDITRQTEATVASGDTFILTDADDSNSLKKDTIQGILDLVTFYGMKFVSSSSPSGAASVAFTGLASGYDYTVVLENIRPDTDGAYINFELGTGATPTYNANGLHAEWFSSISGASSTGVLADGALANFSAYAGGNVDGEGLHGELRIYNPYASTFTGFTGHTSHYASTDAQVNSIVSGQRRAADSVTAIRIKASAGNISGRVYLFRTPNA